MYGGTHYVEEKNKRKGSTMMCRWESECQMDSLVPKIVQNKMPHSLGWNRDFRYRRNSGATMWMRGESPAGLLNALTMTVLKLFFRYYINVLVYLYRTGFLH